MVARRLLTLGHSYVVSVNRQLAREMRAAAGDKWQITCAAPSYFHGGNDLAPVTFEPSPKDNLPVVSVSAYGTRRVHVFSYGPAMRRLLAQRWDFVHAWEEPYIVAGFEVSQWTSPGAKLIYRSAQSISKNYPPPFNWFERASMQRASGWICSGTTVEQNLASRPGYDRLPHLLAPLGVDTQMFKPDPQAAAEAKRKLGWTTDGPPVVGFVGRFVPAKGIHLLMRALEGVRQPYRALFLGAGALERELRDWATAQGDHIRVLHVPHDEVPPYVNAMDLLCAPSQTTSGWREQFGRMLVEAFACGVPAIGSDSGEIPTVIGEAGRVVGEADVAGWTSMIEHLLSSERERKQLGATAVEVANSKYAWPVVARQHLRFFESL